MIDQAARKRLIATIDAFRDGTIQSELFDAEIMEIETNDETVDFVVGQLWHFYDDFIDHPIMVEKLEWDYIERLRLLLASNSEIQFTKYRQWSLRQPCAWAALGAVGAAAFWTGIGMHLALALLPMGLLVFLLNSWHERELRRRSNAKDLLLTPFASTAELLRVHRNTRTFHKHRYPGSSKREPLRSGFTTWVITFNGYIMLSPLFLIAYALPETWSKAHVVTARS
ncbi:MAG: hypothetical protein ACODAQ_01845 [Phycisphaeraceae bacterium]